MYRLRKNKVTASGNIPVNDQQFTTTEVVELLKQINELKGLTITINESADGYPMFRIGEYVYEFVGDKAILTIR